MLNKIIRHDTGEVLDYAEQLLYIRVNPRSGAYIEATEENFEGIAVKSNPYNILGKEGLKDVPTVRIEQADEGELINALIAENARLEAEKVSWQELNTAYAEGVNKA